MYDLDVGLVPVTYTHTHSLKNMYLICYVYRRIFMAIVFVNVCVHAYVCVCSLFMCIRVCVSKKVI